MRNTTLRALVISLVLAIARQVSGQAFNYAEVLQKSMFFYEAQRSGVLPANTRVNWRGDSALNDGKDVGHDLTGGWYDAGDNVKFGFPMAFSATALAWGAIDFQAGYVKAGQLQALKNNLRFVNDYFIKCHTAPNELWGQVGSGGLDHAFWGSPEIMTMARPAFKIDTAHPGSDLAAETAAAMAAASIVFATDDPVYSATLKAHAIQLYNFADTFRGVYTGGIPDASGFYNSFSGFNDELVWGAIWLYRATNDIAYLNKAELYYANLSTEPQSTIKSFKWTVGWDDKSYGCYLLLAKLTGKDMYKADAERNLDFWTDGGTTGTRVTYSPGGHASLDVWGSLRYAANASFLALYYNDSFPTSPKVAKYAAFAANQINYMLGANPQHRSYVCGFGVNPPVNPHHRGAHGAWANNLVGPPVNSRHTLYGALVGGPAGDDAYTDDRGNFQKNEVATDYNALFSGALAKLTLDLGGTPLANFPIPETPTDEFLLEAKFNATGNNFAEYSIWPNNHTAWPARVPSQFKYRIFVDLSEGLAAGFSLSNYSVKANSSGITVTPLLQWNGTIYYTEVTYAPGTIISPAGQGESRRESQVRITLLDGGNPPAGSWNPANDPSNASLDSNLKAVSSIPLYVDGVLVVGTEPTRGIVVGVTSVTVAPASASVSVGSTTTLAATVMPANASNKFVSWTSSNPAVATVNTSGVVTGVAVGTASVTAKTLDGGFTAVSSISVTSNTVATTGVSITPLNASISSGSTTTLTATVAPANATNKSVTWTSSNPAVATVNASGVVTGVASGSATITVTTQSGGFAASSTISVVNLPIAVTGVSVTPTTATTAVGGTTALIATVAPANATNKVVSWSSSNTAIATVNASGVVTGVGAGSATITVTTQSGSFNANAVVTVSSSPIPATGVTVSPATASIVAGTTTTLTASVAPANATNKTVTWTSSSPAIATVNASGLVTGVAAGSATITATTQSGSFTASSVVTVTAVTNSPCTAPAAITLSFAKDGAGEFCYVTSGNINFLNSWNMQLVEINGVVYTNRWSNAMPARVNGNYYIHYVGTFPWSHLEINGN